jgi:hypothetical protein
MFFKAQTIVRSIQKTNPSKLWAGVTMINSLIVGMMLGFTIDQQSVSAESSMTQPAPIVHTYSSAVETTTFYHVNRKPAVVSGDQMLSNYARVFPQKLDEAFR